MGISTANLLGWASESKIGYYDIIIVLFRYFKIEPNINKS
jgi:hypothetical protein